MSLKPRIEALIYAAEEPVTLAQLAALLAEEAEPYLNETEQQNIEGPQSEAAQITAEAEVTAAVEVPAAAGEPEVQVEAVSLAVATAEAEAATKSAADAEKEAAKKAAKDVERKTRDRKVREVVRTQVAELMAEYAANERGMEIREVAGGYRMSTKPEYHDTIRAFVKSLKPALKLSLQALETLAVIAYKQPVTAPEISEIRGVDTSGVLGSLIARKLITTAGRKQVIGRPILYKTTRDFLLRFGLKDISDLPSIEEFEKLASELAEPGMDGTDEGGGEMEAAEPELTFEATEEVEAEEQGMEAAEGSPVE